MLFRELTQKEHKAGDLYGIYPKGFREYIYNKNCGHCSYCGKKMIFGGLGRDSLVIEHVESHVWKNNNLLPACKRCNSKKQNKKLIEVTNFTLVF
jgi:5-methylcytosine-specific restriction endonuclease McrA